MRRLPQLEELRRKLLIKGFPHTYVARTLRELREHWEDLRAGGLADGLPPQEASVRADEQLGSPEALASTVIERMGTASWLGRHWIIGFGFGPLLALALWWFCLLLIGGWAGGAFADTTNRPASEQIHWPALLLWIEGTRTVGYIVLPVVIWWTARRHFCTRGCLLLGCLVIGLHNLFHFAQMDASSDPRTSVTFVWGYLMHTSPNRWNLAGFLTPLLFGSFLYWNNLRKAEREITT